MIMIAMQSPTLHSFGDGAIILPPKKLKTDFFETPVIVFNLISVISTLVKQKLS